MNVNTFTLCLLLNMVTSSALGQEESLRGEILRILSKFEGTTALAFEDLQTGSRILINEREMFHAASTMKTPVMIEVFKKEREGSWRLGDSILIKNEFKSIVDGSSYAMDLKDDSDVAMYDLVGTRTSVRYLVVQMIVVSSNLATNILLEHVGADNVTKSMRRLGADSILVLRGVEDQKAYDRGLNNKTNAYDLMVIFKSIVEKSVVDERACEAMLAILADQEFRDIIPALLPQGTRVAHKTGSITGVEHDSGIVFLPDGRKYILVLLSKDGKNALRTKALLAEVSKKIYDYMIAENVHRPR